MFSFTVEPVSTTTISSNDLRWNKTIENRKKDKIRFRSTRRNAHSSISLGSQPTNNNEEEYIIDKEESKYSLFHVFVLKLKFLVLFKYSRFMQIFPFHKNFL